MLALSQQILIILLITFVSRHLLSKWLPHQNTMQPFTWPRVSAAPAIITEVRHPLSVAACLWLQPVMSQRATSTPHKSQSEGAYLLLTNNVSYQAYKTMFLLCFDLYLMYVARIVCPQLPPKWAVPLSISSCVSFQQITACIFSTKL